MCLCLCLCLCCVVCVVLSVRRVGGRRVVAQRGGGPEGWGPRGVGAQRGGGSEEWGPKPRKSGGPKGGGPKGGGPEEWGPRGVGAQNQKKWEPEGWGPRGVGARRVVARKVGARRVGPTNSRFFFPSPAPSFRMYVSLSGGLLVEFSWCLKRRTLKCARLEFSGCRVKPRRQPESPNVHI